ncbi:hypothetical protein [Moraxella sp. Pampa]|uniref:hypothetical protein n=1 Tax=Moraxella sp. Pampa TaxID=3111978 RepID=UPI002B41242B|nr:hypothetical protein [Moraxella sp. Pampa]
MSDILTKMHKEIDLLQSCINRMANNSFLIKGWSITIVSLILTLGKGSQNFVYVVILPILAFWYLDAFYLSSERAYRKRYEWIINNRPSNLENLYDLNSINFQIPTENILKVMFSKTLSVFYLMIFTSSIIISYLLNKG